MTRLSPGLKYDLNNAVKLASWRLLAQKPCPVTGEEIIAMSLPADDLAVLRRAREITRSERPENIAVGVFYETLINLDTVPKHLNFLKEYQRIGLVLPGPEGGFDFLAPVSIDLTLAPEDKLAKLREWATWRLLTGASFARLAKFIETASFSLETLRYLIPGTLVLCRSQGALADYVERLEDFKVPKKLPSMTQRQRELCRESNELLAMAFMFEASSDNPLAGTVTMSPCYVNDADLGILSPV